MISIVSNNQIVNLLILLPYTFGVRAHSLLYPELYQVSDNDSFFAHWFFSRLGENALWQSIVATLIIYSIAILIGFLSNKYRLFQRSNLFAPYFFVLLASLIGEVQMLSPVIIALLFFALYLRSSLMIYRYHLSAFEIFNVGLFAMLAGLIYPPLLMLIFASFFVIFFFEGVNIKAFLLLILGMISVVIIVYSVFYFFGISTITEGEIFGISKVLTDASYWTFNRILYSVVIIFLVLFGMSRYYNFLKKKIIDARKRITFLFLTTILMLLIPLFYVGTDIHFLLILSLMGSFFAAFYFDGRRNNFLVESVHFILLIMLFGFQFNLINI